MRIASLRYLLPSQILAAVLFLSACGGDGSLRSPDLPPPQLTGIGQIACTFPGATSSIAVGQTATCRVVGGCTYRRVNEDGSTSQIVGVCPDDLTFNSSNPDAAPVNPDTGVVTGNAPGTTDITAGDGDVVSPPITITVNNACAEDFAVTPASTTLISGPTTGTSQLFTATLSFSDGTTLNVSTSGNTTWTSSNEAAATFSSNQATAVPGVQAQATSTATATYTGNVCGASDTLSATASITVNPAQISGGASGICIETVPPAEVFTGCRADTGACLTPTEVIEVAAGETRQLQIRGRFDNNEECNITSDTTLSITEGDEDVATVDDAGVITGVGGGSTAVNAVFENIPTSRPITVVVNQVLGKNSLAVFARSGFDDGDSISLIDAQTKKFSCVGANNLVVDGLGNRTPRASIKLFAFAATCETTALDEDGNCTALPPEPGEGEAPPAEPVEPSAEAFLATAPTQNVSNLPPRSTEPGAELLDDRIVWTSVPGYWARDPATEEFRCIQESGNASANVGDLFIEGERTLVLNGEGLPLEPAPNEETGEVDLGALQPNGVAYSDAAVRIGFNCISAEYENPEDPGNKIVDGMTVLVLPATNDALLSSGSDVGGDRLCEALAPLFGSGPLLGLVEVTNALSAVTAGLSPLLETLDAVPVDGLVTELQNALGPVTGPLVDALNDFLIDPVLAPVVCEVTGVVQGLLGLLTGNQPEPQECGD